MDRLVAVFFGYCDVVFEAGNQRRKAKMHQSEHPVTLNWLFDDDAHSKQIKHLIDTDTLTMHLEVDRVVVLYPPDNLKRIGSKAVFVHPILDLLNKSVKLHLKVLRIALDIAVDHPVIFRIDVVKAQILQMVFEFGDTQTVRDRGVDHQCLFCDTALFFRTECFKGQHIVQPVTEFDHQYTYILDRSDQHLAKG